MNDSASASIPPLELVRRVLRRGFLVIGLFSLGVNILMLTGPLYMLQIYDRVVTTGHVDTLLALTGIIIVAMLVFTALEALRTLIAQRVGIWMDGHLAGPAVIGGIELARAGRSGTAQGLRDLTTVRSYLASPSIFPFFDAPVAPLFLGILFIMHPLLGLVALAGGIVLAGIALANELLTRKAMREAAGASSAMLNAADSAIRNADVITAMGMQNQLADRVNQRSADWREVQKQAGGRSGIMTSVAKGFRLLLQSIILGTGAWLVIGGEMTPGMMIAGSIMMGRALAPVEQAIGTWQGLINAQAAWQRLKTLLDGVPVATGGTKLPAPTGHLTASGLTYMPKGLTKPVISNVSFDIQPGTITGIIGPTGAGKTTLARLLTGSLAPSRGAVRLDDADMAKWDPADRGPHVGYLPQDIELFDGTVRDNIARLGEAEDEEIIAAAQLAEVHDMILHLPGGYETPIGDRGTHLSGGQRQRIGLARAFFREPKLIVLDEPNASLDATGEDRLVQAMRTMREKGHTIIMITHKPSLLHVADNVMVLQQGQVAKFGPTAEILSQFADRSAPQQPQPQQKPAAASKVLSLQSKGKSA